MTLLQKEPKNIKLWTTDIKAVYLWTTKVRPSAIPLLEFSQMCAIADFDAILVELNKAPVDYYNKYYSEWHLTYYSWEWRYWFSYNTALLWVEYYNSSTQTWYLWTKN